MKLPKARIGVQEVLKQMEIFEKHAVDRGTKPLLLSSGLTLDGSCHGDIQKSRFDELANLQCMDKYVDMLL